VLPLADRRARGIVAAVFVLLATVQLVRLAAMSLGTGVYDEDFRQEYCLARALAAGEPLYEPMPVMIARYIDGPAGLAMPTSPNHPPPAALLALPLAAVGYPTAARLWLALQLLLLGWTIQCLARELGWGREAGWIGVAAAVVWTPVALDLQVGNLHVALLATLVASWRAWRRGRALEAGAWLGLGTAIKLVPGYLVLYLLLRREWRAVAAAVVVCAGLALGVTLLAGPAIWPDFVSALGTSIGVYQEEGFNVSLFGMLHRLTHGVRDIGPLLPGVGDGWITVAAAVVLLGPALIAAARPAPAQDPPSDLDWALFVTAIVLVTPLAWHHSYALLVLPILLLGRQLVPGGLRPVHAVVLLGLTVPVELLAMAVRALATGLGVVPGGVAPGVVGLPYVVPTVACLAGFVALARMRLRA